MKIWMLAVKDAAIDVTIARRASAIFFFDTEYTR